MSEFADTPEHTPSYQRVDRAASYLEKYLKQTGSFENLILSIQHDYSGDREKATPLDDTTSTPIYGGGISETIVGTGESYEDSDGAAQLYRLLRIAETIANPNSATPNDTKMVYAGEILGMTLVDYLTSRENDVPDSLLATVSRYREEQWKNITNPMEKRDRPAYPTFAQNYAINQAVANEVVLEAYKFSLDKAGEHTDIKNLLASLLRDVPAKKAALVETGCWIILKEWLKPDYHDLEETLKVCEDPALSPLGRTREAFIEAAKRSLNPLEYESQHTPKLDPKTATAYDQALEALELEFADNEIDFDATEWNRESLKGFTLHIVSRAERMLAAAISKGEDQTKPAVALQINKDLASMLNKFAREAYELDEDDVIFARGTYIGVANTMFPLAKTDENGTFEEGESQFTLQGMSTQDYRHIHNDPHHEVVEHEVRGSFDKIVMTTAISDKDSYTIDADAPSLDPEVTIVPFTPAIRIINVSLIDMNSGAAVEHMHDIVIPLTHSHLELGRFVPPLPESD